MVKNQLEHIAIILDGNKRWAKKNKVSYILKENGVYFEIIGKTQKNSLDINKDLTIKITELNELKSFWFRKYFNLWSF